MAIFEGKDKTFNSEECSQEALHFKIHDLMPYTYALYIYIYALYIVPILLGMSYFRKKKKSITLKQL